MNFLSPKQILNPSTIMNGNQEYLEDDEALRVHNGYKGGTLAIEKYK